MNISGLSSAVIQSIAGNATVDHDAVVTTVLKKAMDIQASQASQLIESVAKSMPQSGNIGSNIDIHA